jgi:hypothetical protein
MATVTCNLVYRHENGEVEGFVGKGADENAAHTNGIERITRKCAAVRHPYQSARLIDNLDTLTAAETAKVQNDWRMAAGS